jgi:hypothetical protein
MVDPIPAWFALEINGRIVFQHYKMLVKEKAEGRQGQL